MVQENHRIIILSGPSGVGKSPLYKAVKRFYPKIAESTEKLVMYNDRSPRPGEQDGKEYHFRTTEEIKELAKKGKLVTFDVRGDLQALDVEDLLRVLKHKDVIFEGNPFVGSMLLSEPKLANIPKISFFMSLLSKAEIMFLKKPENRVDLENFITDVMRRKLLRRTTKQKGILSLKDLENIEKRAGSAYKEMKFAWCFDQVIPNHDGEDSENWDAFYYLLSDARKSMESFASMVLFNKATDFLEKWDKDLLG